VRRLIAICPGFAQAWQAHLDWWEGEPAGDYNDVGALAQWVVERIGAGELDCLPALFQDVEAILEDASDELRNLLLVGFLEDVQNVAANTGVDPDVVLPFLGPESRKGWFDLIKFWHGPDGSGWVGRRPDS